MKPPDPRRYSLWGAGVALASGILGVPFLVGAAPAMWGWALLGWVAASLTGVACGARLEVVHGTPGASFLVTLGACILARSVAFLFGAALVLIRGGEGTIWPYLGGFAVGYVSTQVFEGVWFLGKTESGP